MILLHRHRFNVAAYHRRVDPEHADQAFAQGLVVDVELKFEHLLNGRSARAEAFLDPGADETLISLRWLSEQAGSAGSESILPVTDPAGFIDENIELSIAGRRLPLGDPDRPLWIATQGDEINGIAKMPGCEDVLLGRDFMTQHGLLLLIAGSEGSLSLLLPSDSDNRQRREDIREAFDPEHHPR